MTSTMAITATQVKTLRERTGAGMMDCKKALQETDGDIEAAIEVMRKSGVAKAAGKAGRIATEGVVAARADETGRRALLLEVNCETDFVAKDENFRGFVERLTVAALAAGATDPAAVSALPLPETAGNGRQTVEEARQELVARLGENIQLRRFTALEAATGRLGVYAHGARIAVAAEVATDDAALARDLCMHIAAAKPLYLAEADAPPQVVEKEKEILSAQAAQSGKPAAIVEKMVAGRLAKFLKEITLLGQPYVKEPEKTVGQWLRERGATALSFVRFEVGEGMEKKADDFAAEVKKQAGLA